jgi:hypothetical protein
MSPQTIRITLTGTIETAEAAGGFATENLVAVEDRPAMASTVGRRMRYTLTERFMTMRTNFDGPEARPLAERCLLAFGSSSGPPMLPVLYNNHYQIVQSRDTVMILVEMMQDPRVALRPQVP